MTILRVTKAGLEVYIPELEGSSEGQWIPVDPKPGYLVVNFASTLEMMLNGQVNSALHRVRVPDEERLSIGMFIDPAAKEPVLNLVTGETLYNQFSDYLNLRFSKAYVEKKDVEASEVAAMAASAATSAAIQAQSAAKQPVLPFAAAAQQKAKTAEQSLTPEKA